MGSSTSKVIKKFDFELLPDAQIKSEQLGEVKIGLKEIQAKNGGVSLEDWQSVWKKATKLKGDYVDGLFQVFDELNNQWVDFREYAVWAALVGRNPVRRKISYCYRVFDRNGNGVLEKEELILLCEAVARTIKRVGYNNPGSINEYGHSSFELSEKEKEDAAKVAKAILKECTGEDADGASYKNIQAKWAEERSLKEVAKVLNFFDEVTKGLPTDGELAEEGPFTKKYKSNKEKSNKGKDKKGKKGGKSKKGKKGSSKSEASASGSEKKGKAKKGKKGQKKESKKGSKKGSKKDKSEEEKSEKAAKGKGKKGSKKDKSKGKDKSEKSEKVEKASKKGSKKDKSKGKDKAAKGKKASKKDKSEEKSEKAAKGKGKKASKKDKSKGKDKSEEKSAAKSSKKDKSKGKDKKEKSKKGSKDSKKEKSESKAKSSKKDKSKGKDKAAKGKKKSKK